MKKIVITAAAFLLFICHAGPGSAATIDLWDYAFNIDGTLSYATTPAGGDLSGFDDWTGIGTISVEMTGAGDHYFVAFFDHEIDQDYNTFFQNEYGEAVGTAAAGQSWEIDEPGYAFGDIYDNVPAGSLDNFNNVPTGWEDDVSMAMGWDFYLESYQTATISLILSTENPGSAFYLSQTDPDSEATIYFSSTLTISGDDPGTGDDNNNIVPEPSTIILFGIGLLGLAGAGRRKMG